jgi:hypothetical protein
MSGSVGGGSGFGGSPRLIPKPPKYPKIPPGPPVVGDRRRYIHFYGEEFANGRINYSFDVMAGDQPPTIVDGYAQWSPIPLPLRVGQLMFTGRNPISMQVAVRFNLFDANGTWLISDSAGLLVEEQIAILEWMAGEGINEGPSPLLRVTTYDSSGDTVPLIPFEYQVGTGNVPASFGDRNQVPTWVVTALAWDPAPIRNDNAYRIRQDGTVTIGMYQAPQGSASRLVPRPKATTVVSRDGADTALTIARSVAAEDPPKLATAIIQAAQNKNLQLRSVNQAIKHGKRVTVPSSVSAS